jgi:hypothetical protein
MAFFHPDAGELQKLILFGKSEKEEKKKLEININLKGIYSVNKIGKVILLK